MKLLVFRRTTLYYHIYQMYKHVAIASIERLFRCLGDQSRKYNQFIASIQICEICIVIFGLEFGIIKFIIGHSKEWVLEGCCMQGSSLGQFKLFCFWALSAHSTTSIHSCSVSCVLRKPIMCGHWSSKI